MSAPRRPAVDAAMGALGELVAERRRASMAFLRECDLSMAQLHVLATLHERGDMTVGTLAEALSISAPSASTLVDRLVERGMVRRERSEDDRRTVRLSLSPAGQRFTERIHGLGADQFRRILARLSDADLAELARLTDLVREASIEEAEPREAAG